MIDKEQAQMLATLACAARPYGARRWDPAGVVAAIGYVRRLGLAEVTHAVMNAAANADLHTPGAIGNTTSEVWRSIDVRQATPTRTPYDRGSTCGICGRAQYDCQRNPYADHDFESQAESLTNARPRKITTDA